MINLTQAINIATIYLESEDNRFRLPNGRVLTKEAFLASPLFSHTPEREEIFSKTRNFCNTDSLRFDAYRLFINSLKHELWTYYVTDFPEETALLSIIAYFNGDIDQEELFVIQTVATAKLVESQKERYNIEKIKYKVITNIADYLTTNKFPPYSENIPQSLLTHRKPTFDLSIIENWHTRSWIKKTVVEYTISPHVLSVDNAIINYDSHFGFRDRDNGDRTFCLLPPIFFIQLAELTSSVNSTPALGHHFMFGHNDKFGSPLYDGIRIVSLPSA